MGVPPWSARGLRESLEAIDAATDLRRDVNGNLDNFAPDQMKKYKLTLECSDVDAPALVGVWAGKQIVVGCVSEMAYETGVGTPERTPVSGSERVGDDGFTRFRPELTVIVTRFSQQSDEGQHDYSWQLEAEEA
jgi:hypothetical protein